MAEINTKAYQFKTIKNAVGLTPRAFAHNFAIEPGVADEINFFAVPKDVKILAGLGRLAADRLDVDGAPTLVLDLKLSDGVTTHDLVSAWTGARSATAATRVTSFAAPAASAFVTNTANFRLYLVWTAAAATFAPGKVYVELSYTVQDIHEGA